MKSKKIIFWGASGQAKVLREFIGTLGYELVAIFDNNPAVPSPFSDVPVFHGESGFVSWRRHHLGDDVASLVAIGGAEGRARLDIQKYLAENGVAPITAIHPSAVVAANVAIGAGTQILANATVCADVVLGSACIVNTASSVDHECRLGNGVHIGPGTTLAGCIDVGDFTFVGMGAVVLPRVKIGKDVIIGAGAVVTRDIPDRKVVYGNPARVMRDNLLRD